MFHKHYITLLSILLFTICNIVNAEPFKRQQTNGVYTEETGFGGTTYIGKSRISTDNLGQIEIWRKIVLSKEHTQDITNERPDNQSIKLATEVRIVSVVDCNTKKSAIKAVIFYNESNKIVESNNATILTFEDIEPDSWEYFFYKNTCKNAK